MALLLPMMLVESKSFLDLLPWEFFLKNIKIKKTVYKPPGPNKNPDLL